MKNKKILIFIILLIPGIILINKVDKELRYELFEFPQKAKKSIN